MKLILEDMIRMLSHIVKPGESLWTIVNSYGLNPVQEAINKIIVANKLWRVPYLTAGQVLTIPLDGLYYIVKPGDSLWSISMRFNIPMDRLIALNNLAYPYTLNVGMHIRLQEEAFNPKRYLVCLDPGHQRHADYGTEPIAPGSTIMKQKVSSGTQGVSTGKPEYELNLEVALKVEAILKLMGYNVLMTRTTNDVNLSNIERAQIANNAKSSACVRIHADSSTDSTKHGISVQYPAPNSGVSQYVYQKSKLLAELLLKDLIKETNAKSDGIVPRADITGFNWSTVPVALVEMGFMSNPAEDIKMSTQLYQYKIAEGISEGIDEFLRTDD
jgi:N-acetylmuramoyl-L-alanine amidase